MRGDSFKTTETRVVAGAVVQHLRFIYIAGGAFKERGVKVIPHTNTSVE
jgi:hypothetical protein